MKKQIRMLLSVIAIGAGYYIWLQLTDLAIPCMFRKVTGWLCPGCGITTLILCLGEGNLEGAYHANPFLFVTGPLLIAELIYYIFLQTKGRNLPKWNNIAAIVYGTALCLFGVWRNIFH